MSSKLEIPIRKKMAIALFNRVRNGEQNSGSGGSGGGGGGKLARRRRVFVQTETGCVLGMDLERGDNAHTVKRRLQVALNIPTNESSLTYGDTVFKNDLSSVRNDSPLLLTRNIMQRSSSTPCLSPNSNSINSSPFSQQSESIQILGGNRFIGSSELVREIVAAISSGVDPIPVQSGLGGAYFFRDARGETVAIVKPTDEEPFAPNNPKGFVGKALGQPGLKRSVRVGETGFREVAAYLLDCDHSANVPLTVLVKATHSVFNVNGSDPPRGERKVSKIASLQRFIAHDFDASDYGTSSFPVSAVHRIGILDVRIFNTDRHAGNILVRKPDPAGRFGQAVELTPIDHGLCLPESLEDPYFEWVHWPQASIPFSDDELEYINKLDPARDSEMLRRELPMIREACLRVLVLCTVFLKEAARFGLCLSEIGEMMSREFRELEDRPSELEVVCLEARRSVADWNSTSSEAADSVMDEEFVFDMDNSESALRYRSKSMSGRSLLSKLDEDLEDDDEQRSNDCWQNWVPPVSSSSNKFDSGKRSLSGVGSVSGIGRSANEQMPSTKSFVKLADMSKEEWLVFLDKFKELLYPAFVKRKSASAEQGLKLRLGTSCRF